MKECLRQAKLLGHCSDADLDRVIEASEVLSLQSGDLLFSDEDQAKEVWVLLEGQLIITKRAEGQDVIIDHLFPGSFLGEISLLTQTPAQHRARAKGACRLLRIPEPVFQRLLGTCPTMAQTVLQTMAERVRRIEHLLQRHERMAGLGTIAAGLAHELNNPASAGHRAAELLHGTFSELLSMTRQLLPRQWTPDEIHLLSELQKTIIQQDMSIPSIDPVMRSDREEALAAWLEDHGIAQAWDVAPNLAGIGLTSDRLEALANGMSGAALKDILTWIERSVAVEQFIQEVGRTTARISDLVRAVKAYSHVDQVSLRSTNVQEDIENALLMLGYKVRQAAIQIERRYETNLPTIQAYGTELQQVWTNLIDNAVDALESSTPPRRLEVRAATDGEFVNVSLIDNGPGIPPEIQPRIFDPFFTTKAVGKGTGLGLEIVKRIINRHCGTIRVESKPGETRFEIRLPIRQPTAPAVADRASDK